MIQENIQKIQNWLNENNLDVAYLHNPSTISYLTSFISDPHERIMALFITKNGQPFLFVPALEVETAKASQWPYQVIGYLDSEEPFAKIANELQKYGVLTQCAIEKDTLPVLRMEKLKSYFETLKFDIDITPFIQNMKLYKSTTEKQLLLEAGQMADMAFEIGFNAIQEGISEQEIVAIIETEMKKRGVAKMSFDTLVLAGAHAADPHGVPSPKITIQPNELVLFDLGCMWKGYASDATRMASFKEPSEQAKKIFDIVLEAQIRAQNAVKPGITAGELDSIARDYITKKGYGEYFIHRLGHGIGQSCHEYPSIVEGNDLVIEEGMCFSIEPGIYIPNEVGVRVEDCVYVEKNGSTALTKTPKTLKIIK